MQKTVRLSAGPESVGVARHFVRDALVGCPTDVLGVVELLTSELVTNAITHGGNPVEMEVEMERDLMKVTVLDANEGVPEVKAVLDNETHGRGMFIVDAYAERWGIEHRVLGKAVWFEVGLLPGRLSG